VTQPDPLDLSELRRISRSRPRSGREAAARMSAIRVIERAARRRQPVMPPGWHPMAGSAFEALDDADPIARRERWFSALNR
jgi:hypothetical protein